MATIKSYTDIEQSKKLAEILPLESADMHYNNVSIKGINYVDEHRAELMEYNRAIKVLSKYTINPLFEVIPCWSLTTLLNAVERLALFKTPQGWACHAYIGQKAINSNNYYDNPIDAVFETILKLHKLNIL